MDDLDKRILALLAGDARMSVAVLARRLSVARSTVQARLERLETSGVIAGYTLRLGTTVQRARICATVLLGVEPRAQAAVMTRLKAISEVESAHTTSGRFDLLLGVAAETTAALDRVLDAIGEIPGVKSSESLIHLSTKIDRTF
ncbi:Lrp/AsnC family transcriptional regulator [Actibacterium sp. D379-3]